MTTMYIDVFNQTHVAGLMRAQQKNVLAQLQNLISTLHWLVYITCL